MVGKFIDLIPGVNPGGPGFIGGLVSAGANFGPGDPMPGVVVQLYDALENPIGYALTDQDGKYEFSNLPFGAYDVYVDILNKKPNALRVEISSDNPRKENSNFSVNGKDITFTGLQEATSAYSLNIYPNPSNGQLFVEYSAQKSSVAQLEMIDMLGKVVYQKNMQLTSGRHTIRLDELNLDSGVYFLKMTDENNDQFSKKVVFK